MVRNTSKTLIVQRQFTIDASQKRVWDLLAKALYKCLPLENMDIVNETTFYADLRWNMAFISLKLRLGGKFVDISPPSSLGCALTVKWRIIKMGMRVTFLLRLINDDKTEVVCLAIREGKETGGILRWVLREQQRRFAGNVFDSMRTRLERVCCQG